MSHQMCAYTSAFAGATITYCELGIHFKSGSYRRIEIAWPGSIRDKPSNPWEKIMTDDAAGACRLAGLHPLGQRPVQDALAIAGGVTVGDAEGGQHLFRRQADQFACGRGGAEDPDRRGAMPAPVERARKRDAARYVQTERDRQQDITPSDSFIGTPTGTPQAVAYREDRPQHGNAGMDGTPGVQRVVEIQRMTHAGIQQCRLRCGQAGAPQQHTAFLTPAPPADHRKELIDPRRAAAAEHAAKSIEDIASGGFDGARG